MNKDSPLSPLGAEMVAGLSAFCDAIDAGVPLESRYTVRTVTLDLEARPYEAGDVQRVRREFNASQTVFAQFLGVSVKTLRSWEQGVRPVPTIACRFMDEMLANRELWSRRIRHNSTSASQESCGI
jgi:putative transcriptional regulator